MPDDTHPSDSDDAFPQEPSAEFRPTVVPDSGESAAFQPTLVGADSDSSCEGRDSESIGSLPEFGSYELIEEIARGGMGVVYKARDTQLDRVVAVKTILNGEFASSETRARFLAEATAAARLDHPGIIPVYEISEISGRPFFSMKYLSGGSLQARMGHFRFDLTAGVSLLARVCRAVQHAHERGVLHRDLKPANILLDEDGNPLVADLGLARALDSESRLTQSGAVMGTPGYMSPEQASGEDDTTTATDVYALGAILFEMLTGRPPHEGRTAVETLLQITTQEAPPARSINPDADRRLELVCRKCLALSPDDRYESAKALADDLERWLQGDSLSVSAPSLAGLGFEWIRRNARAAAGAAIVGVIFGLLIGVSFAVSGLSVSAMERAYLHFPDDRPIALGLYSWVDSIPAAVRGLNQFLLFALISCIGAAVWLTVRPRSNDTAVISGILAGLCAAVLTYLISFGWQPISSFAVDSGADDIRMLSRAAWSADEVQRDLARRAMIRRYPGLEQIDKENRADILSAKVLSDQSLGIPAGLWTGVGLVGIVVILPAVAGTAVFGRLAEQQGVKSATFGRYFEAMPLLSVVVALLMLYSVPALAVLPPVPWRILIVAAMLLTVWSAVSGWKWYLRLLLHAGWLTVFVFYVLSVQEIGQYYTRAAEAAAEDRIDIAVSRIEDWLEQKPRHESRFAAAIGHCYLGDSESYADHCRQLMSAYTDDFFRPASADRLARVVLLQPDAHSPGTVSSAIELAEIASSFSEDENAVWFFLTRAVAEYRRGNWAACREWSQQVVTGADMQWQSRTADTLAAMASWQLGESARAAELLERAESGWDREQRVSDGRESSWMNRLYFLVLLREAQREISGG